MCKDGESLDASVRLALAELRARQPRHPSLSHFWGDATDNVVTHLILSDHDRLGDASPSWRTPSLPSKIRVSPEAWRSISSPIKLIYSE